MSMVGKAATLSAKDEKKMKAHAKHHTPKHLKDMRKRILAGESFMQAHKNTQKTIGKADKDKVAMVMREFYAKKLKNAQGKIVTDMRASYGYSYFSIKKKK